jgi:serine/threonine protein phosphatase PrpC
MSYIPFHGQPVTIFAEECDQGAVREENQDFVFHFRIDLGDLLMVADGSGGYAEEGATASQIVVENYYAYLTALPSDYPAEDAIREATKYANANIVEFAGTRHSPQLRKGSAVVVALLQQENDITHAWIGHIGDCRAYLLRAGRLHRLTTDHTAVQSLLVHNLILPEEAENHPESTVLTRSLGRMPEVEIDIEQHPLGLGDTLLLCSDGLWRTVPDREIEEATGSPALEDSARNLLELAMAAGGQDNIAIEMARLIAPPDIRPQKKRLHPVFKWVLGLFLLAIAGLCVLAYYLL